MMMMMIMMIIIIKDLLFPHSHKPRKNTFVLSGEGNKDGAVVSVFASHQCGPGSIPGLGVICGLSLLLVLVIAPLSQKPTLPNFNSILRASPISTLR